MKTLKTYQQQVRCCLVINILDFTWCSFDLLACLSLNADAFSWKSVISRFHDLIQAAAARLVWSTAVARRRSGWVALGVAVELFIAVLFKPPLSLSMCHQHCLSAKWLHRSSEDGVWWDIKTPTGRTVWRSHCTYASNFQLHLIPIFLPTSFSAWSKKTSWDHSLWQKVVSSKACDWLLWSSVWRWYLQTPMIQGSKLQKPRDLRTGPRAASC